MLVHAHEKNYARWKLSLHLVRISLLRSAKEKLQEFSLDSSRTFFAVHIHVVFYDHNVRAL